VSADQADTAIQSLKTEGLHAWTVGDVVERPAGAPQTIVI
jgi:phosphoribosylformylglycinamidine cyclo-ligase